MYTYKAKITEVYDGDTVTALVDVGFHITHQIKIRLYGINAPELRGDDREKGLVSRNRLAELILNKEVIIKTLKDKQEKYGRWLAEIYLTSSDIQSVNKQLVSEGLAVVFMES